MSESAVVKVRGATAGATRSVEGRRYA